MQRWLGLWLAVAVDGSPTRWRAVGDR